MNTKMNRFKNVLHSAALAVVCSSLLLGVSAVYADDPEAMAPPVASAGSDGGGSTSATSDSVFNWSDVPQNQRVTVDHATFDEGGYQIYDTSGETIVVPFKSDDLYVMKFAISDDDTMYFVNKGNAPVLYVPEGGYLENATVSGARWYPFPPSYHPSGAVYLGPAPSWDAFVGMGWYPGMYCYGGYWCNTPYWDGGVFVALPGLFFQIGGHQYWGWNNYHSYYIGHPGWYHPGFYNRNIYHWAGRPSMSRPPFGSVAHPGFLGGGHFGSNSGFRGTGHFGGSSGFRGADGDHAGGFKGTSGGYHTFRGADSGSGTFGGGSGSHVFRGADSGSHSFGGGSHNFGGGGSHTFGGSSGSHTFGSSSHTFGGGSGSHSFGGGSSGHSFGGSGGGHTFHGSDHSGDDRGH